MLPFLSLHLGYVTLLWKGQLMYIDSMQRNTCKCRLWQGKILINSFNLYWAKAIPQWGSWVQNNWVGVCGPLPKTFTLLMTKICNFLYPIYDLTKNLIPYSWPDSLINTMFQMWKVLWRAFVYGLINNDESRVVSSKKHTQFKTRVQNPYPIYDKNGQNWYLLITKTAEKPFALGPHIPI